MKRNQQTVEELGVAQCTSVVHQVSVGDILCGLSVALDLSICVVFVA